MTSTVEPELQLRKFPYPYRSMLAISSDTDRTTITRFRNIHRFLNTEAETPLGPGVGLDVSDSLWVYADSPRDMSLLQGFDRGAAQPYADELTAYAQCGWIDTLHTYGNYSMANNPEFERRAGELAIEELRERDLAFSVWVNHGNRRNTQNFGVVFQEGDLQSSPSYHTDLLLDYGIRFAWNHRHGEAAGLATPIERMSLRDNRELWGFARWTQSLEEDAIEAVERHPEPIERHSASRRLPDGSRMAMLWWPEFLDIQFAPGILDGLVERSHYCVVAQHLGDLDTDGFTPRTAEAFRVLRGYQDDGRILVARTSRLLEYARVSQHLQFETRGSAQQLYVDITAVADPVLGTFVPKLEQLRGVTFYVRDPMTTHLLLDGKPIRGAELVRSPSDGNGPTIGVQWFKPDRTDYVAEYEARSA